MAAKETIIYVTREIERALGIAPNEHYRIITNRTAYGEDIKQKYPDFVTLVDDPAKSGTESLGTGDLISHPETARVIAEITEKTGVRPYLLVFKNTARIEPLARERGWMLVNPPAQTCDKIENKISQVQWLAELERYLPRHRLEFTKNIRWNNEPFILQWAHGHTGGGTMLVNSEAALQAIKEKFPERRSRVTSYIKGPSYTVNVIVTPDKVAVSSVSYQITGLPPFTDGAFATIGNDWGVAKKILSPEDAATIQTMVQDLGAKMQHECWRGLFGVDLMKDEATNKMYLIELNARQPASTTFESSLQGTLRAEGKAKGLTTMEAHIASLLGQPLNEPLIELADGAQIVQRVTKALKSVPEDAPGSLELAGYDVISYPNTRENEDLIRVQSLESIMSAHGEFNDNGKEIIDILSDKN